MKKNNILKSLAVLALSAMAFGCTLQEFEEITQLSLKRCLEPQNLSFKIDPTTGDNATFGWDVNKDADAYNLVIYTNEAMTTVAKDLNGRPLDLEVLPAEVPCTIRLIADQEYWFRVRAYRLEEADPETGVALAKEDSYSNWAVYDGSEKTYAVKDNLFLEVTARTANSVSFKWSKDVDDYKEVTKITASPVKGGSKVDYTLTTADINAATATVSDLAASTEYQFVLYYMSASRGAVDTWTLATPGSKTVISTEAELKAAVEAGGEYYLTYSDVPYNLSDVNPLASLSVIGELDSEGKRPVVITRILVDKMAAGSSLYFEGISFDGNSDKSRVVERKDGVAVTLNSIKFVNCEVVNYKAGLFYEGDKADAAFSVDEIVFDTCDIHNILASGGDAFDIRKNGQVKSVVFNNNTIWDGIRTLFRIDQVEANKLENVEFTNNTVKNICTINDSNNRGLFAFYVPVNFVLRNNVFLWEDGGKTADDVVDYTQLVQENSKTVVPTITAENNYTYAQGKDFFKKVSAAEAGFKVLNEDPCYNSKGNFFQLVNDDLVKAKVGASKWWVPFVEKDEDLTQNVVEGAHTWNLQDATLFAGEVKNSRVRDELLLVGTEATPLNADGGINFLGASALTRKGVPTEGYIAFKVNTPGSVDLELANGGASSVVVALQDDGGFQVIGGAMASSSAGVQKIVIPAVNGEGMVYLYSTGAISLKKLAWSLDTIAGNKVLSSPKLKVEPVTLFEGDETAVTVTWEAIDNAASYALKFNKKPVELEDGALSYTVPAETIAALEAGLYSFAIKAIPVEGDIYYKESAETSASFAIQPKGQVDPGSGPVTITWDFTAEYATKIEKSDSNLYQYESGEVSQVEAPSATEALYFAPYSKKIQNAEMACTADGITYHPITYGGGDAYMFVYTAKSGKLRVWATVGKSVTETGNCDLQLATGPAVVARKSLTTQGDKVALSCYDPSKAFMGIEDPIEWEIVNESGNPQVLAITKPSGSNSPWIYRVEFVYEDEVPAAKPVYKWNFTEEYVSKIEKSDSNLYQYESGEVSQVEAPSATEALYFAPYSKKIQNAEMACTADGITYYPITYGGGDAYMFVYTAKSGKLRVWATVGKSVTETGNCDLQLATGPAVVARKSLTTQGDKVALSCYDPSKAFMGIEDPIEWEIVNESGNPQVLAITKPSGSNSPWIYAVEFEEK